MTAISLRHPGLDPGSMNTVLDMLAMTVFMDSSFRWNDDGLWRR